MLPALNRHSLDAIRFGFMLSNSDDTDNGGNGEIRG